MKNVFWCLDGFNHGQLLLSYRFNCSDGFTISTVIMIDLESRFVYALWLSNLGRIFCTVSTNFHHMKNYHRLSLTCSYRLMTSYLCMDIITLVISLSAILCRDNIVMFGLESL